MSGSQRDRLTAYLNGDSHALGHLAAVALAEALGLKITYTVAPASTSMRCAA